MTSAFWRQNILRHFTWSAPPLLYSWSDSPIGCSGPLYSWSNSPIGCSAPLYSRSGSLIWSAYYFLYVSFCFRFNKSLTNLTLLRQHHLQYINMSRGDREWQNQGILKGEVSLYHWPPVWLVWNQLYDIWWFLFLFVKQTTPNQFNRRSMVQWYFPL